MNAPLPRLARPNRAIVAVASVVFTVVATASQGILAAEPSAEPSASPSLMPAEAMCRSASDLGLIVGFLRDTSIAEDGVVPSLVGAIAGLGEAQQLVGLVDETYRPLVDDLVASFQGLRSTLEGFSDQDTLGAGVVTVGEAISAIGVSMDALSVALRDPCPSPSDVLDT